jgi:hypothetical protein
MRTLPVLAAVVAAMLSSCGGDSLHEACKYTEGAFDIEQVSVLEDATGWTGHHDAVMLTYDTSRLPPDGTWRLTQVDVLAMIPDSQFAIFPLGLTLGVEVFDANVPSLARRVIVWQTLNKSALSWTPVTLTNPAEATELTQQRAWWSFDLTQVIADSGLTSSTYVAGVVWPDTGALVKVGYSNFNRACNKNWTDYADGEGWQLNGTSAGNTCSWPMLRVKVEVTDPQGTRCGSP